MIAGSYEGTWCQTEWRGSTSWTSFMLQRKLNLKLHHLWIVNLCVGCVHVRVPMLQSAITTHLSYVCVLKHITARMFRLTGMKSFHWIFWCQEGRSSAGVFICPYITVVGQFELLTASNGIEGLAQLLINIFCQILKFAFHFSGFQKLGFSSSCKALLFAVWKLLK